MFHKPGLQHSFIGHRCLVPFAPLFFCTVFFLATYNVLHIQRALAGGPQRVMSCASGEALAVKVVPPGSSENVLHILFFFQGGFEGELI